MIRLFPCLLILVTVAIIHVMPADGSVCNPLGPDRIDSIVIARIVDHHTTQIPINSDQSREYFLHSNITFEIVKTLYGNATGTIFVPVHDGHRFSAPVKNLNEHMYVMYLVLKDEKYSPTTYCYPELSIIHLVHHAGKNLETYDTYSNVLVDTAFEKKYQLIVSLWLDNIISDKEFFTTVNYDSDISMPLFFKFVTQLWYDQRITELEYARNINYLVDHKILGDVFKRMFDYDKIYKAGKYAECYNYQEQIQRCAVRSDFQVCVDKITQKCA